MVPAWYQLADHRGARHFSGKEEAAGRLCVGQQQGGELVHVGQIAVGLDPGEVASGAAADVTGSRRVLGTVEVGDGGGVDGGAHAAGADQLVEVAEQSEAGDVG